MNKKIRHLSIPEYLIAATLSIFLIILLLGVRQDVKYFYTFHDIKINIVRGLKLTYYSNHFIQSPLLLFAVIGFFLRNPLGWVSILSFFYFIMFDWIFITMPDNDYNFFHYFVILIPLIFVFIANIKSFKEKYMPIKVSLLTMNIISIIISLLLTFTKGYFHLNYEKGIFEMIKLIQ